MYILCSTALNINKENVQVILVVETMLLKQPSNWKQLLLETNKLLNTAIISRSVVFKPQLLTIQLPWTNNIYVEKLL